MVEGVVWGGNSGGREYSKLRRNKYVRCSSQNFLFQLDMAHGSDPHPQDPHPEDALFPQVNKAYQDVWKACPFTTFALFHYLIEATKDRLPNLGSWENFLRTGQTTLKATGLTEEILTDTLMSTEIPEKLWKDNSGDCTSFAKRVVHEAGQAERFTFGDTKTHRAGTHVMILS